MSETVLSLQPYDSAHGQVEEITEHRWAVLAEAFEKNPNRFKYKLPVPENLPKEFWINYGNTQFKPALPLGK